MNQFGTEMGQSYGRVTKNVEFRWYNMSIKQYVTKGSNILVGGKASKVVWFPKKNRDSRTKLNVLSSYVDITSHVWYLFTYSSKDGYRVLVTQKRARGDGLVPFVQTSNQQLRSAFKKIVRGQTIKSSSTASNKTQASSNASSTSSGASASSNGTTAVVPAKQEPQFPAAMQGTWYSYTSGSDYEPAGYTKVVISGNKMTTSQGDTTEYTELHDTSEYTAAERRFMDCGNYDGFVMDEYRSDHWGKTDTFEANGYQWFNVRGWYQSAGDGESFCVINRSVDGQTVPVLTTGYGAGTWVDKHMYRTPELAHQQADVDYPGDVVQSDE
ncbi:hypothetical protein FD19_GL001069 [Lacticaseibacillus thailandensis DSM 22698 = JCM 13996]|uniref:DUF4767 domain-containing protein n=2 Tax=Lacticaseibacillus thailandensis TaxID=381741 RepID=A0A0R2CHS3_9LACO|nr:hypothetical protein FD19_GL001069 [Lacticaseibacillus thailandensis DSM 22698 = JCM 13996]